VHVPARRLARLNDESLHRHAFVVEQYVAVQAGEGRVAVRKLGGDTTDRQRSASKQQQCCKLRSN
jgi:hypothetical protein